MGKMENALTVDVEDWFHVCGMGPLPESVRKDSRVREDTEAILDLLARCGICATFFILGSVAEEHPGLAPHIARFGHEIASHGWSHRQVFSLTPAEFREELRRTGDLLEQQTGLRPVGFRAPQWSLGSETPWAFDILRDEGFRYDSSLNPLPFVGNRRGLRTPHRLENGLWELPPLTTACWPCNLPTGGGWGLRFFPESLIRASMGRLNRDGFPAVLYLHPREMATDGPRLPLSRFKEFVVYGPRHSVAGRLDTILTRFRFTTAAHLVGQWDTASSSRRTTPPQPFSR